MARRSRDPLLLEQLGKRLHLAREQAKLSQQRLAEAVGVRPATISLFECGDLSPTLTTLSAVAEALHVPLRDLLDFGGELPLAAPGTALEIELLEGFRGLSEAHRGLVVALVRGLQGDGRLVPKEEAADGKLP